MEYAVNPISADAALHGLIAILEQQGDPASDAPYIPVRIGCATVLHPGVPITRATIEIRSASAGTVKADMNLFDASGRSVMQVRELRLKRTRLRQQASLEARSFHYQSVASRMEASQEGHNVDGAAIRDWIASLKPAEPESTTLLVGAAAYRVAFDVVETHADPLRQVPASIAPGDPDKASFYSSCLQWLEKAGLVRETDGNWSIVDTCDVPDFPTLLNLIGQEDSQRLVEAIALSNARLAAMRRDGGSGSAAPQTTSGATLDHLLVHSVPAQARLALLEDGIRTALTGAPQQWVVELASASASLSRRIAELVLEKGGRYIIVEEREQVRDALSLQFASMPHVEIVDARNFPQDAGAALLFSAYHDLYSLVADNAHVPALFRRIADKGGALLAVLDAPGIVADVAHGQEQGWISGGLASQPDWKDLLHSLGMQDCTLRTVSQASGDFLVLGGFGRASASDTAAEGAPDLPVIPVWIGPEKPFENAFDQAVALSHAPALVYDPGVASGDDGPMRLQAAMTALAYAAKRLDALSTATPAVAAPPLLVLLDGGAPATSGITPVAVNAANAGIWMFLRTVRNEYPDLVIHSIDCQGLARGASEMARLLANCLGRADTVEWVLPPDGGLRELRAVAGPFAARTDVTDFEAAKVSQATNASIAGIGWTTARRTAPSAGQIVIEVAAAGLNFRDVMWAMGLLPAEALEDGFAGMTIGMECAGTVVAVAPDVSRFAVGDRVMAFAPAAFATHVTVDARAAMTLPDSIGDIAGATIPVAFLTAYYALVELGRIKNGETVLLHGGAGGVGLAALQIAKLHGAKVIATAGSKEKRALLRLLGADHVLDSRSLAFVPAVGKADERRRRRPGAEFAVRAMPWSDRSAC